MAWSTRSSQVIDTRDARKVPERAPWWEPDMAEEDGATDGAVLRFGDLELDARQYAVRVGQRSVTLIEGDLALLRVLVEHGGKVVPLGVIRRAVAVDESVSDRALSRRVQRLRSKLGCAGDRILSVPGSGYMLLPSASSRRRASAMMTSTGGASWAAWLGERLNVGLWSECLRLPLGTGVKGFGVATALAVVLFCVVAMAMPSSLRFQPVGTGWIGMTPQHPTGSTPTLASASHDWLGGLSGIGYAGEGHRYAVVSNRGPEEAPWLGNRLHWLHIEPASGEPWGLATRVESIHPLLDRNGRPWPGRARQQGRHRDVPLLDAEAVAVLSNGTVVVAEEFGPSIHLFEADGRWVRSFDVPESFRPGDGRGVMHNRGFEGIAVEESGGQLHRIIATLQAPLVQDGGEQGRYTRILDIDTISGTSRQFAYRLDRPGNFVRDLVAIGDDRFVVLEQRQSQFSDARYNTLVHVQLHRAGDVSEVPALPINGPIKDARPVRRTTLAKLHDAALGLRSNVAHARYDGMTLGPPVDSAGFTLMLISDNGFDLDKPTMLLKLRF
jgi:DNA-binding winged helix-turn-helix (wHTH) protein